MEFDLPGIEGADAVAEMAKPVFEPVNEEGAGVVGTLEVADNSAYLPPTEEASSTKGIPAAAPRRVLATPVARALARELGVNIDQVTGTGPAGRVMREDIENFVKGESKGGFTNYNLPFTEGPKEDKVRTEIGKSSIVNPKCFAAASTAILVAFSLPSRE